MTEYFAAFAPENLPEIAYTRVNKEQAEFVLRAAMTPENQEKFDVTLLPLETSEQRQAAAEEWAGYEQAKGQVSAREQGAALVLSSRDRSPEALLRILEDKDGRYDRPIPLAPWVTHALMKVVKLNPDAQSMDLLREYYERATESEVIESENARLRRLAEMQSQGRRPRLPIIDQEGNIIPPGFIVTRTHDE